MGILSFFGMGKKDEEVVQKETATQKKMKSLQANMTPLERQEDIGSDLQQVLLNASLNNKVIDIMPDGTKKVGVSHIKVEGGSGKHFVITVTVSHKKQNFPIMDIDVDMERKSKEIYVKYGGAGSFGSDYNVANAEESFDAQNFELAKKKLSDYIKRYRLFRKEDEL